MGRAASVLGLALIALSITMAFILTGGALYFAKLELGIDLVQGLDMLPDEGIEGVLHSLITDARRP